MEETGIQFKQLWSWFQPRQYVANHTLEHQARHPSPQLIPLSPGGSQTGSSPCGWTDHSIPQTPHSRTGHGLNCGQWKAVVWN